MGAPLPAGESHSVGVGRRRRSRIRGRQGFDQARVLESDSECGYTLVSSSASRPQRAPGPEWRPVHRHRQRPRNSARVSRSDLQKVRTGGDAALTENTELRARTHVLQARGRAPRRTHLGEERGGQGKLVLHRAPYRPYHTGRQRARCRQHHGILGFIAMTSRPTVYIETYGCQMNVSDSELMLGRLIESGYESVAEPDGADVILINTCAIREHAEQRVMGRLGEMKSRMKRDAVLGVTGCMAQRLGAQLLDRAKHVSLVVGPDGYRDLPSLIDSARAGARMTATEFDLEEHYEDFTPRRFEGVKAWIPVQRGCDYRCTYCIVPTTRGPERSRRLAEVLREAEAVVASGISEIVLLGQTVNSYFDGEHDFADLVRAVGSVPGVKRLRFTSPHPNDFSERVVRALAETESVCEHVHLPMQSGSTRVLKRMLRRYTRERYLECVDELRAAIPDLALTTDIIVGFPGE